ncbi:MAG: DUF4169 family protein [Alphaproteobacteria bacterium]
MGDVVNLNQYRKKVQRAEKEQRAAVNRARAGRSKSERRVSRGEAERRDAVLDGSKLEREADAENPDDDPDRA